MSISRHDLDVREVSFDELFRFMNLYEGDFFVCLILNGEESYGESIGCCNSEID